MKGLKTLFGITGDIFDSHVELKKLCVKNRENIVHYIDRVQIAYNNIIEVKKSERGSFTNSDVASIDDRFMHAFY